MYGYRSQLTPLPGKSYTDIQNDQPTAHKEKLLKWIGMTKPLGADICDFSNSCIKFNSSDLSISVPDGWLYFALSQINVTQWLQLCAPWDFSSCIIVLIFKTSQKHSCTDTHLCNRILGCVAVQ